MKQFTTNILVIAISFLASGMLAAAEAEYPSKPVRLLVGYTPGGGVDVTARLLAINLTDQFKQAVVVDNRPGAQSDIAAELVARAAPDGYTLTVMTSSFAVNAATVKGQKFDALKDFQPIALIAENPNLVVVNPSVPAKTLKELIAHAKAYPGKLNIGYTGSTQELFGKEFIKHAQINAVQVPYKGAGNMATALLANEVQLCFFSTTSSGHFVREGRMRALAIAAGQRSNALPDVPTTAEAGLPKFRASTWYGMLGPAGMPKAVVDKLNAAVRVALKSPQFIEAMKKNGQLPIGSSPEEFRDSLKQEIERYREII
jgi:tripartite-type tricarboxylate transporter receptor subunit TctC